MIEQRTPTSFELKRLIEKWKRQKSAWLQLEPFDYRAAQVIEWCIADLAAALPPPPEPVEIEK